MRRTRDAADIMGVDDTPANVLVATNDRAEVDTLRSHLVACERLVSLGALAAGVGHEINNPLAVIYTNIAEARTSVLTDGALRALLDEAADAADRIRVIVRDLHAMARVDDSTVERLSLAECVDVACRIAGNEIRQRARLVRDFGSAPHIEANRARIGQVLLDLVINAAQAIPIGHADEHEIRVATLTSVDGHAVFEITDTGRGISRSAMRRLFDPCFTAKPIGTGLGLSVAHGIVTSLGGAIEVRSEVGRGSTFRVTLPAAPADAETSMASRSR